MVFGITRQYIWGICPFVGFGIGWFLDRKETERMVLFRDKSALYGRPMSDAEKPSWP